eukprot:2342684-Amphidinium_carterae.1
MRGGVSTPLVESHIPLLPDALVATKETNSVSFPPTNTSRHHLSPPTSPYPIDNWQEDELSEGFQDVLGNVVQSL